jgi:hypothetical protein
MVEPFMESRHFKCPKCNEMGMVAKLKEQDEFHLIGDRFRLAGRGEGQEIVCVACGVPVKPETST